MSQAVLGTLHQAFLQDGAEAFHQTAAFILTDVEHVAPETSHGSLCLPSILDGFTHPRYPRDRQRRLGATTRRHLAYPLPTWDDNDVREALTSA